MKVRRLPLGLSIALLSIGSIGIAATRTPIEVFLCAELVTVSAFYIFFTVIIPSIRPTNVNPERVFLGGAAKSPYLSANELYSVGIPLISEDLDDAWEQYFDSSKVKLKTKEAVNKNE